MKRLVIDWDGTLVPDAWPEKPSEWLPGARESLDRFLSAGCHVRIHSCRTHSKGVDERGVNEDRLASIDYIRGMLDGAGFQAVEIILDNKPGADWYIDNKAMRFDGNWGRIARTVLA